MRYRLMATYRGIPYEADMGPTSADIVVFASTQPDAELGFEAGAGHWRKRISRDEADVLWEYRPVGRYRSQPCLVLEEIGDRLHITYLGHDAYQAERLGYWQVDRGVYEVVVPRDEVIGLTEERVEHPVRLGRGSGLPARAQPGFGPPAARQPQPAASADAPPPTPNVPPLPTPVASPAQWDEYKSWDAGAPALDHAPSANGAGTHDPAWSANGAAAPGGADALAGWLPRDESPGTALADTPVGAPDVSPAARDEPSDPPWTEMLDTLPPPRPLPKRRRPEARPGPATDDRPAAAQPATVPAERPSGPQVPRDLPGTAVGGRRRRARVETRWIFRDLVDMAAIPHGAYAVDEEIDGALCLIKTDDGYEVFSAIDGTKHEVRFFEDEEAAYFYLFGVLAAEAVRNGQLVPKPGQDPR